MNLIQIEAREGRVKLNDAVSQWSADELIDDMERLYGASAVEAKMEVGGFVAAADDALHTVYMEINSLGGSVFDGYRIYNAIESMKQRGVRVVGTVNGKAASMATVILMAADVRRITRGSAMRVHDASVTTFGNAADHLKAAETLEAISAEISEIYAERTGATADEMRELMAEDRWMVAAEALEKGFVDELLKGEQVENLDNQPENKDKPSGTMSILDKFKKPDEALVAKVEGLETDLATALTELEEAKAENTDQAEQIADLKNQLATADQSAKELATQAAEAAEAVARKDEEVKAAKESASQEATEILAAAAHPQIAAPVATTEQTDLDIVAEYLKLPVGQERADFRAKHPKVFAKFSELKNKLNS